MADTDQGVWTVDTEVSLFYAMRGHKPVGVNKHFQMICIHDKMNNTGTKKYSAKQIWNHLAWIVSTKDDSKNDGKAESIKESQVKSNKQDKSEKSDKVEGKQVEKHTSSSTNAETPENTPKRKRTRQGPSAHASPATPDAPPSKRRR
ncbi:hypothetical protein KUTeg_016187 [Tegillarca granosa]|uniref:No apical meristem-associated C-terminal domain-containing protein n=1 Tax=Tegillarca granosa TaxID=220873 RepID=A0ABQ9ENY0_TEGGR|nr:hypothetical protein KUTeg_016187 [Tegillarca granosa]